MKRARGADVEGEQADIASLAGGSHVHARLADFWRQDKFCDVVVQAGGTGDTSFKAHRLVLAAGSDYLAALSDGERFSDSALPTINLPDVTADSFRVVLDYLYDGTCSCEVSLLPEVGAAASFLQVAPLLDKVGSAMAANLTASNVISSWSFAERLDVKSLWEACRSFAATRLGDLRLEDFASVSESLVRALVTCDIVSSEILAFDAVIAYARGQSSPLSDEVLASLLAPLHFPQIGREQFLERVMPEPLLQNVPCKDMLLMAFADAAYGRTTYGRPGRLCVIHGRTAYRVLPDDDAPIPNSDDEKTQSEDPFVVPEGWRIVAQDDANWDDVLENVIKPHGWATHVVCVARQRADLTTFVGFETEHYGEPGTEYGDDNTLSQTADRRYQFGGSSFRLLIAKVI